MNERRIYDVIAFLSDILYKVATGQECTDSEIQSLQNIADEFGFNCLDENTFRW